MDVQVARARGSEPKRIDGYGWEGWCIPIKESGGIAALPKFSTDPVAMMELLDELREDRSVEIRARDMFEVWLSGTSIGDVFIADTLPLAVARARLSVEGESDDSKHRRERK